MRKRISETEVIGFWGLRSLWHIQTVLTNANRYKVVLSIFMDSNFWLWSGSHGLKDLLCINPNPHDCCAVSHVPPSQSWVYWAALLGGRCCHCPTRSPRGRIQIHFCIASSLAGRTSGQSCAVESESNRRRLSSYHRRPETKEQLVVWAVCARTLWETRKGNGARFRSKLTLSSGVPRKSSLGSLYTPEIL